uniref:Ig-like domain-containing protein n=1 Tax=Neogobius melanostomus TaxID=47308 RepID=A0A8C6WVY0_9GOBI
MNNIIPLCYTTCVMFIHVCYLFFISAQSVEDQIPVTVVQPGDNVTIKCSGSIKERIHWFRQTPGHTMQFIAEVYYKEVISDSLKDKRFSFTIIDNLYVINIRNVRKEDEAIYYCQMRADYAQGFINSTFLIVNDEENSQNCVHHVRQSPSSASVSSGGSVSLQCSLQSKDNTTVQCPQHHKVLWFRAGSEELNTGVMYNFTNNSCVYSLSKTIGHSSDTGTYYCAVDTCGHVLFGDGTRVEMGQSHFLTVALSVLLSCCVLVIIVLCLKRGRVCAHCRAADINYAALNFSSRKVKPRSKTRREQECVYSTVRAEHLSSTML